MSSPSIARPLIAVIAVFLLALIAGGVALYMDGWRPAEMLTARSVEEPASAVSEPERSTEDNAVVETMPSDIAAPGELPAAGDPAADGPVFDVVRVEPNGEALIAGRAAPDADVEVLSDGDVVATAKADSSGAFVAMPEQPLGPGGHKLSLRVAGAPEAESAPAAEVAVVVPSADGSEGAEVAAAEATPGDAAPPAKEQQVASVAPINPPVSAEESAPAAPADSVSGSGETEAPQEQSPVAGDQTEPSPGSADTVAAEPSSAPVEQNQTADAGTEPPAGGPDSAGEGPESASEPAADQHDTPAIVAESASAGAGTDVAGSSPEPALPSAGAPAESDSEQELASAADAQNGEAAPSGSPAADATASASTAPAPDALGSAAEQQVAAVEPAPADSADAAAGPTPFAAGEQPLSIQAVETEGQTLFVAGAAEPGTTVRVFADEELIGEAQAGQGGNWLIESEKPITEPQVTMRVEEATESEVEVPEAVETDFVRLLDSDVLVPAAAPVAGAIQASAEAMPGPEVVIIRRGDTLWQLSRRNYGRGVRYDTIYSANKDQIRSPHWIYPGQVFVLPRSDRAWTETR